MPNTQYVSIDAGTPERIDGLCTTCWTATLWKVPINWLRDTGVTDIGTWSGCLECRTGLS